MREKSPVILFLAVLVLAAVGSSAGAGQQVNQPVLRAPVDPNVGLALLKPDLFINKIWFAKWVDNPDVSPLVPITTSLKKGVKVWMVCDLVNQGNRDITSLWLLGFYIDDVMKWNNSWGNLAAGKTLRGLGPYSPTAEGTHSFRCTVDVNKQITESREDNNNKEVFFMVVK
jgi:hypothetical protein